MLIIVNSMSKCGSTWFHNYVMRCLGAVGEPSPHQALAGRSITLNRRANPGALDGPKLAALVEAAQSQSFAVKAHVPPNPELLEAVERDQARMMFIIRRPADIVRSALAYGEFCRTAGREEPYRELYEPEDAARFVAPSVEWAVAWLGTNQRRLVARYEDLFAGDLTIRQAAHRLEPRTAPVSAQILEDMRPSQLSKQDRDWLRVNLVRRPDLSDEVLRLCEGWAERLEYPSIKAAKG